MAKLGGNCLRQNASKKQDNLSAYGVKTRIQVLRNVVDVTLALARCLPNSGHGHGCEWLIPEAAMHGEALRVARRQ